MERRRSDRRTHLGRLAAYLLLIAISVGGFHNVRVESYRRCLATNANARVLRDLVHYSLRNTDQPLPPGTPEAVVELVRRGKEQALQLGTYTDSHVHVVACAKPWPG